MIVASMTAILLQGLVDAAKIIGLPHLKTMDKAFAKANFVGAFQDEVALVAYSRKEFIKNYIQRDSTN